MSTLSYPKNRLTDTLEREYARRFMLYHYHQPATPRSTSMSAAGAVKRGAARWVRALWKALEAEGQERAARLNAIHRWY